MESTKGVLRDTLFQEARCMIIAPSILTADFCELGAILDQCVDAGMNWIHLDIMMEI